MTEPTMYSRDMDTLPQDGPQLAQFESPAARPNRPENVEALAQRPQYSPVAQPGMISEIHYHTVRSEESQTPGAPRPRARAWERPTRGMFARLHQPTVIVQEKGGRGGQPAGT